MSNTNYEKYLKYKLKYLELKNELEGGNNELEGGNNELEGGAGGADKADGTIIITINSSKEIYDLETQILNEVKKVNGDIDNLESGLAESQTRSASLAAKLADLEKLPVVKPALPPAKPPAVVKLALPPAPLAPAAPAPKPAISAAAAAAAKLAKLEVVKPLTPAMSATKLATSAAATVKPAAAAAAAKPGNLSIEQEYKMLRRQERLSPLEKRRMEELMKIISCS